jgi:hypothetical protein
MVSVIWKVEEETARILRRRDVRKRAQDFHNDGL